MELTRIILRSLGKAYQLLASIQPEGMTTYELALIGYALTKVEKLFLPLGILHATKAASWMDELLKRRQKGESIG